MLDFLFKRISMPRVCMVAWLRIPELVEQISQLDSQGIRITNEVFLEIAEPILYEISTKADKDTQNALRLSTLRRGINRLKEAIAP